MFWIFQLHFYVLWLKEQYLIYSHVQHVLNRTWNEREKGKKENDVLRKMEWMSSAVIEELVLLGFQNGENGASEPRRGEKERRLLLLKMTGIISSHDCNPFKIMTSTRMPRENGRKGTEHCHQVLFLGRIIIFRSVHFSISLFPRSVLFCSPSSSLSYYYNSFSLPRFIL